ncbi:ExeM/NucH family extracellular endonuclease [Gymnodinialimonas sp. 2305UL16-5]|uniref:ExeM/NucH family extracellular endonuclease n=1 Tax=Gymnodinialimonas mytili TaxID=3126503 RepID=UPI0030A31C99
MGWHARNFIFGSFGSDEIEGTDRRDTVFGLWGDDTISTGAGSDLIFAGWGDDTINAGAGDDRIFGGRGFDTAVYEGGIDQYEISLGNWFRPTTVTSSADAPDAGTDRLTSVEALYFKADDYTLFLDGTNNAVLARDDQATVSEDGGSIEAAALLANDQEFDGDTITIISVDATSESGASVSLVDGQIVYNPGDSFDSLAEGETATDTFTYLVDDGKGGTDTATVTVTIVGQNDAPALFALDRATLKEGNADVAVVIAAQDADGDTLTYSISGGADAGLFTIDAETGLLSFIDTPDFAAPVDAGTDNTYDVEIKLSDGNGGVVTKDIAIDVARAGEPIAPRINEIHYDNDRGDVGEFVEIRVEAGTNVSDLTLELYNGSNGQRYNSFELGDTPSGSDDMFDYYVVPTPGIQNGGPDGLALIRDGEVVVEFLSYEGTMTASNGTASGLTSTDIGVSEPSNAPIGVSLQRGEGDTWTGPIAETRGTANTAPPEPALQSVDGVGISELAVSTTGFPDWEFIELMGVAGTGLDGYALLQLDGDGEIRSIVDFTGLSIGDNGFVLAASPAAQIVFGVTPDLEIADNIFTNTQSTFLLVDGFTGAAQFDDLDTDDDGALDVTPFANVLDSVAFVEGDRPAPLLYSDNVLEDPMFLPSGAESDGAGGFTPTSFNDPTSYSPTAAESAVESGSYSIAAETDVVFEGDAGLTGVSFTITRSGDVTEAGSVDFTLSGELSDDEIATIVDAGTVEFAAGQSSATFTIEVNADVIIEDDETLTITLSNPVGGEIGTVEASVEILDDDDLTLISDIQGSGAESALVDQDVTVKAIVTYVVSNGFFLQEEDADNDGDAATSEGIFVFTGDDATPPAVGDQVVVRGSVGEFRGETQLDLTAMRVVSSDNPLPTAASVLLDGTALDLEAVEGMRISLDSGIADERITVIENFNLDRFGEITVSAGRQTQPTQLFDAQDEAADVAALQEFNANNRLIIDDGLAEQNPDEFRFIANDTAGDNGNGFLDAGDTFTEDGPTLRLGAEIDGATEGVLRFAFGEYRMLVDDQLNIDEATNSGARPDTPDEVGGDIQVASVNVLNYFTTLRGDGGSGPNNLDPRGAGSDSDLARQTEKLVDAFLDTKAEIFAVQEVENGGFGADSAIGALVDALTAEATDQGTGADFAFVDPTEDAGFIGTDAITTGIIYDKNAVTLLHADFLVFDESSAATTFALADVLNAVTPSDDQVGDFQRNRPAVAATFQDNVSGETFTVVSNHFKSKGPSNLDAVVEAAQAHIAGGGTQVTQADIDALLADPNYDQDDGQAFWNQVRTDAAAELKTWIETVYNGGGVDDYLLLGDLNAYAKEDPVQTLTDDDNLRDLIEEFIGQDEAYSFVFDGQQGALDHAIASNGVADLVTGVTEWHINADEPDLLSYNSAFNDAGFFEGSQFASSDHDPLIIGLDTQPDSLLS